MNLFNRAFIYASAGLFLMACNDDEPIIPPNTNSLIGTWGVDLIEIEGVIAGIPVDEQTEPSGTITFNADFTGKENYSYTIPGTTLFFLETDEFTWISSETIIVFDPGDPDETTWTREINSDSQQIGNYRVVSGSTDYIVTITLSK